MKLVAVGVLIKRVVRAFIFHVGQFVVSHGVCAFQGVQEAAIAMADRFISRNDISKKPVTPIAIVSRTITRAFLSFLQREYNHPDQ
jgi:hypothetical protein